MEQQQASWHDFNTLDIRVGTIIKAEPFEKANKPAYILHINFGEIGIKKSSAQITVNYTIDQLIGKQIIAVVNFPPKQIANIISDCLVLGAVEGKAVTLLSVDQPTPNGLKIG
jgi:tRNA-binding protein